jgi:hypothetical protein
VDSDFFLLLTYSTTGVTGLLPYGFSAVYFRAYIATVNAARFDAPTRGLNAALQGAGAIIGTFLFGFFVLDQNRFWKMPTRVRAYVGLSVLVVITVGTWLCSFMWQVCLEMFTRFRRLPLKERCSIPLAVKLRNCFL